MNHDQSQGMGKHMLLMLVCCLVPLALILAVSVFGLSLGALQPLVPFALVLMCPLMMVFMMRGMGHDHGASDTHQHHTNIQRTDKVQPNQLSDAKDPTEQKSCH